MVASILRLIFGASSKRKKKIFISFAIEDVQCRNFLIKQSKNVRSPFEFIDMSVKKPWPQDIWKRKCRSKIKNSDGVIVLVSENTHQANGVKWEIKCAFEEEKPTIGMYIKKNQKIILPKDLRNIRVIKWSWKNLEAFIDSIRV